MHVASPADRLLLLGGVLVLAAIGAGALGRRLRLPALLASLLVGMAVADDGLGLVRFGDARFAQGVAVVALVVILFEAGLVQPPKALRPVLGPALSLATVGVAVTAGATALVARAALGTSWTTSLLVGSVVASTDAAAVVPLVRRAGLPSRLQLLLEAESGLNDPVAVLLVGGLVAAATSSPTVADGVLFAVRQVGVGVLVGALAGRLGGLLVRRAAGASPELALPVALGIAATTYGVAVGLEGSGFLATYLCGSLVAGVASRHVAAARRQVGIVVHVAELALFILLGLLAFPSRLLHEAPRGALVAAGLVLVARPLAVALSLAPFRVPARQVALVVVAGLRGAVPLVLATFPLVAGVADAERVLDVAFVVVVLSVLVQSLAVPPAARWLGLAGEPDPPALSALLPVGDPTVAVAELVLPGGWDEVALRDAAFPEGLRVAGVVRDGALVVPEGATRLLEGDRLVVLGPGDGPDVPALLDAWACGRS